MTDGARIAFLGPEGTFAHAALLTLPEADGAELLPQARVVHAGEAVRSGAADAALVPLENSGEGGVPATLDELANGDPRVIVDEAFLPVRFDLLARPGTVLTDVAVVATHPHAEAQTRRWLMTHAPAARIALLGSTAAGAAAVAAGDADASVSTPLAATLFGLVPLAADIADRAGAVTRFVLLARPRTPAPSTGNDRTSLVAYLRSDHPGALLELVSVFADRGVNMTRIESRPTKDRLGDYCFSIDCEGHVADARVGDALAALRRVCADVRYLGSYPRREGVQSDLPVGRTDLEFADAAAWLAGIRATGSTG